MSRKDRSQPALVTRPDGHVPPADDHVHRLREMLMLMAPECGTSALGAGISTSR